MADQRKMREFLSKVTAAISEWRDVNGTFPAKAYLPAETLKDMRAEPGRKIPGTYKGEAYEIELFTLESALNPGKLYRLE